MTGKAVDYFFDGSRYETCKEDMSFERMVWCGGKVDIADEVCYTISLFRAESVLCT